MAFMQPEVFHGVYFSVETSAGTEIVPGYVFPRTVSTAAEAFADYVEGAICDPDELVNPETGWLARLSAPGYLDCTDWTAHATESAARDYLAETYGGDDE